MVMDISSNVSDLSLPEFYISPYLFHQLVRKFHYADILLPCYELDIDLYEVFLLVVCVVVSEVFLQLLDLSLKGGGRYAL